jgi:hypothetical protein
MKSYSLKFSGREEGPYEDTQIAQMFADGRVNRNTPCKPASGGEWKSVDDYLPMLKYVNCELGMGSVLTFDTRFTRQATPVRLLRRSRRDSRRLRTSR